LSPWRGEIRDLPGGGLVVNDAYNANPVSMRAALVDLAERAGARRRVAILGQMAELGEESEHYHAEIASLLDELGIEVVVAVGDEARGYLAELERGIAVPDAVAFDPIAAVLRPGDAILVKGSRAVGLEGIPMLIQKHSRTWSES
jgi:UDP-N-acetylmuramoyl-tripeptide--D-alanyl-D-alanine ligase